MILYHATTEKKARQYRQTGHIIAPVRGFTTFLAAMAWSVKVERKVIYRISPEVVHKLPDHHNKYGEAYWTEENISDFHCVFSPKDG